MSTQAQRTGVPASKTAARPQSNVPTGVPASKTAARPQSNVPTLQATRASERQADHLRVRSTKTPRIQVSSAKWVIGGTRSDERKWLEKILDHLHTDPGQENNASLLRFMLKEWLTLRATLHTVATMEKVKTFLIDNGIPYLRRMPSVDPMSTRAQKWEYWNDCSTRGMAAFVKENVSILHPTAPAVMEEEELHEAESIKSTETEYGTYGNTSSMLVEDTEESQELIPTDTSGRNPPSLEGHGPDSGEETTTPDIIATPAAPLVPRMLAADGQSLLDLQVIDQRSQRRSQETHRVSQMAHQFGDPTEGNPTPTDMGPVLREFEGILMQRVNDASSTLDTRQAVWKDMILQLQQQVTHRQTLLEDRIREHENRVLRAETTLTEWEQMLAEQEERLESKEEAFMARLHEKEAELWQHGMQQLDESFVEHQSTKILEAAAEWEDHILTKAQEVMKEIEQRIEAAITAQMAGYMENLEETARQRQLRTKAWMEVAATQTLDMLTEKLKTFHDTQQAKIEEFVTVQTQNLEMDLDEFRFHAQETLHAGIFGPDMPNPRARYAQPPSRAIPVEELEEPARRMAASRAASQETTTPRRSNNQAVQSGADNKSTPRQATTSPEPQEFQPPLTSPAEPTKPSRWKNVDYEALRAGHMRSPPTMEARSARQTHDPCSPMVMETGPVRPHHDQKQISQDSREDYIARLRKTPTPMQLRGQERHAVVTWYNSFLDFLKTYRVPIKIFEEFQLHKLDDPNKVLYPLTLDDPHLYDRYSAAIYARLEADDVLDPDNQVYMGLLCLHNSTRDGYTMLKAFLASTLLADVRNISILSTPPLAAPGTCPFAYAASLKEFFEYQAQLQRKYHPREQALTYLQAMQPEPKYTAAAMQLNQDLERLRTTETLPDKYTFNHLPVALVTHQGVLRDPPEPTAMLNVTHSRPIMGQEPADSTEMHRATTPRMSATRGQPRNRLYQQSGPRGQGRSPQLPPPQNRTIQCESCGTNGHAMEVCKILPRVYACMELSLLAQQRPSRHCSNIGKIITPPRNVIAGTGW
jgi:hypothetical protein